MGQPSLEEVFTCVLEPGSDSALTGAPHAFHDFAAATEAAESESATTMDVLIANLLVIQASPAPH